MTARSALVAAVVVAVLAGCGSASAPAGPVRITYQVRGFAYSPTVTYRTADGSVTRRLRGGSNTKDLDEDITVDLPAGAAVSLTVESTFYGDKGVTCIIVGSSGQELARNTADGQKVTASCEARAE